jgi:hypothetical protein
VGDGDPSFWLSRARVLLVLVLCIWLDILGSSEGKGGIVESVIIPALDGPIDAVNLNGLLVTGSLTIRPSYPFDCFRSRL